LRRGGGLRPARAARQAGALPPFGFQALLQAQARDLDSALAFLQDARQYLLQAIQTAHAQQQRLGTSGHGSGPSEAFSTHSGSAQTLTGITNYSANTSQAKPPTGDVITHNAVQAGQMASQAASVRVPHEAQETGSTKSAGIIDNNENSTRYRGPSIHPDAQVEICDPVPMPLAQVNKVFRAQLLIESSHRPSRPGARRRGGAAPGGGGRPPPGGGRQCGPSPQGRALAADHRPAGDLTQPPSQHPLHELTIATDVRSRFVR